MFFKIEMLKVAIENCILISKSLHKTLPKIPCDRFTLSFESHRHTEWGSNGCINALSHRTKSYGRSFVAINAIYVWNFMQRQHQRTILYLLRAKQLKDLIINHFFTRYI